jgi:hypothetical protein
MQASKFEDLDELQNEDVARAAAIVAALHFEATRIAQRRVGPMDSGELGSIVVALATVYATLPSNPVGHVPKKREALDLSGLLDEK